MCPKHNIHCYLSCCYQRVLQIRMYNIKTSKLKIMLFLVLILSLLYWSLTRFSILRLSSGPVVHMPGAERGLSSSEESLCSLCALCVWYKQRSLSLTSDLWPLQHVHCDNCADIFFLHVSGAEHEFPQRDYCYAHPLRWTGKPTGHFHVDWWIIESGSLQPANHTSGSIFIWSDPRSPAPECWFCSRGLGNRFDGLAAVATSSLLSVGSRCHSSSSSLVFVPLSLTI